MRCTSHSATSTSRVASSLVAVAALKPMLRCSQSPNCVIARSRYEGLPFSSNHDHLRPPPRPVFRHHGGGRRHHRGRHLPDPGGGGGACRLRGARARRLAAGRRGRPDRGLLLRRAGPAPPAGGRRLRLPAGDVGAAARVPVWLDPAPRHRHGRDRRRRRDVRELRPGARRPAAAAHGARGRGRDRPRFRDQLRRCPASRRHPEHLHDSQARRARRAHRRGVLRGNLHRPLPPSTAPEGWWGVVVSVGAALVPILFTYGGWQQTNFIAEEIIDAERNLPRALVTGVAGVVVVYVLANVAYLRVLGSAGLAASTAPAADVMRALLGPAGGTLIAAGIAVSTFGFLNLVILVTPRVLQAMAADGVFFPRLAELHPVHRTPAAAILVQAGWAVLLTVSGTFGQLVDYVAFGDWIFFGLTVAGLFIYRTRDKAGGYPAPAGAFRVPGCPWTPGLFVLAAVYVVLSAVRANPGNAAIGAGLIALGVPVYLFWTKRRDGETLG